MPIVRITKKQLEAAAKARQLALKKNRDLRALAEHQERLGEAALEASKAELPS